MFKAVALGIVFGGLTFAGAAEASIVSVTYFGQLDTGNDVNNIFGIGATGATNVDLRNQFAKVTYQFDTSNGTYDNSGPGVSIVSFGTPSVGLQATIAIGSKSVSFAGDSVSLIGVTPKSAGVSELTDSIGSSDKNSVTSVADIPITFSQALLTQAFGPITLTPSNDGVFATQFTLSDQSSGTFVARTVSVSVVPLPSSLPLFSLALAGLGIAAGVRKRSHSVAAE